MRDGKIDERQRVVAQEVANQAQRVEGVVGQQVCTPARVGVDKMQGTCIAQCVAAWLGAMEPVSASRAAPSTSCSPCKRFFFMCSVARQLSKHCACKVLMRCCITLLESTLLVILLKSLRPLSSC